MSEERYISLADLYSGFKMPLNGLPLSFVRKYGAYCQYEGVARITTGRFKRGREEYFSGSERQLNLDGEPIFISGFIRISPAYIFEEGQSTQAYLSFEEEISDGTFWLRFPIKVPVALPIKDTQCPKKELLDQMGENELLYLLSAQPLYLKDIYVDIEAIESISESLSLDFLLNDKEDVATKPKVQEEKSTSKKTRKRKHELHLIIERAYLKFNRPRSNSEFWELFVRLHRKYDSEGLIQLIEDDTIMWCSPNGTARNPLTKKTVYNFLVQVRKQYPPNLT